MHPDGEGVYKAGINIMCYKSEAHTGCPTSKNKKLSHHVKPQLSNKSRATEIEPAPSSTNTNPVSAHLNNKTVVQISKGAKAREIFYIYLVLRETRNLKNKSPTEDLITSKRLMDSACLSCKGVLKPPSFRVALVPANTCCIVIGAMHVHVRKP